MFLGGSGFKEMRLEIGDPLEYSLTRTIAVLIEWGVKPRRGHVR
jgi:hypothetical protein